jgi:hypothetical protein
MKSNPPSPPFAKGGRGGITFYSFINKIMKYFLLSLPKRGSERQ